MKKRLFSILLLTIYLCTQMFTLNIVFADDSDIVISYFSAMKGIEKLENAPKNEKFDFWVTFENRSGGTLSNVNITIDQENSSFYVADGSPTRYDIAIIDNAGTVIFPNIIHKGSGNKIVLLYEFTKDGLANQTATETLYIPVDQNNNTPPSNDQYSLSLDPVIEVSDDFNIPVLTTGENTYLTLPISNITLYTALDVKVTVDISSPLNEYITFNELKPAKKLSTIAPRKTEYVSYGLYISKVVESGIYPVVINYEFTNIANKHFSSSETIHVKVDNKYTKPNFEIGEVKFEPEKVKIGEEIKLIVELMNTGSSEAEEIKVYLEDFEDDGYVILNSTNQKNINKINGNTRKNVDFIMVKVNEGNSGICSMKIRLEYKDEKGDTYSKISTIIPSLSDQEDGSADLIIASINGPLNHIISEEEFTIEVVVKNTGTKVAKNIKVTINPDSAIIPKSLNIVTIDSMLAGESKKLSFKLEALPNVMSKNYAIPVIVEYDGETGNTKNSTTKYIGVNILNEKNKVKTVPKIIIDNYGFDSDKVKAGKEFNLNLSFLNTSKDLSVKNIKVMIISADGSFTPVNSSNTFYIEKISADDKIEKSIVLYAKPDLSTKSYQMTVKLQYEDENGVQDEDTGRQYEAEEIISIPIVQEPRLQINELNLPHQASVGTPLYIYTQFYNMGRSALHNLLVKVEGDFDGQDLSYFAGDFTQGSSDYFEGTIYPNKEGELKGNLIFTFEDEIGTKSEIIKEFTINVTQNNPNTKEVFGDMPPGKEFDMPVTPPQKGKTGIIIALGVGAVLVITTLIIIIRKNRAKRKGLTTDE